MYNLEDRKMKEINYRIITLALLSVLFFMPIHAQNCQPSGTYTDASGEKNTIAAGDTYAASAPLSVSFTANPVAGINPNTRYEWHFLHRIIPVTPYLCAMKRIQTILLRRQGRHLSIYMRSLTVIQHAMMPSIYP